MSFLKFSISFLFMFSAVAAQASSYSLTPERSSKQSCKDAGFVGRFSVTKDTGNIYTVKFTQTGAAFKVFSDGPHRLVMSISGDWQESIKLDFAQGTFYFSSTRPPVDRNCDGRIGR